MFDILHIAANAQNYDTLQEGLLSQSVMIKAWLAVLLGVNFISLLFVVGRKSGAWFFRIEPVFIIGAIFAGSAVMEYLFAQYGYVRLLGLGHLVTWLPVYIWVWSRRTRHQGTLFGKYLWLYFGINAITLIIDFVDVMRYFL